MNTKHLNKIFCLAVSLIISGATPCGGQSPAPRYPAAPPQTVPPGPSSQTFEQRLDAMVRASSPAYANESKLTRFNLDFPGGTPRQLVAAIEKAMGKPLNAIISDKDADAKLPPIKMTDQDVANLFRTLEDNSAVYFGNEVVSRYGFKTIDPRPSDNSLWTFFTYTKPVSQTQFSLDFPGGTPPQLVQAIEKAMGKPLNVIINKEDEKIDLPALKMNDIYLPQLFAALEVASQRPTYSTLPRSFNPVTSYGFRTADGPISDTSIWYFHVDKPASPPVVALEKSCNFYSLAGCLDRGFTVDDITTAIQTGWKLAGQAAPELNYHKETRMLIVFGDRNQQETIQNVLNTLPAWKLSRNGIEDLKQQVHDLQAQVEELKKAPGAAPASPAEKSGK